MDEEKRLVRLSDFGLTMGDLVTFASDHDSTGGVIFQIVENYDSPVPHRGGYWSRKHAPEAKGLQPLQIRGYTRLKPVFEFAATSLGSRPRGKGSTVIVYHDEHIKKVAPLDIITLGVKYAELGNLIRDIALKRGMATKGE